MVETMKEIKVAKFSCQDSLLFHTRYFFKQQYGRKFVIGDHHKIICDALERVLKGQCKRLIINIAPRYGKTELAVKNFISHGLSINPSAKFIHLSYSDDLALDNSEAVKDLIQSEGYQRLFPEVKIKKDSKAKDKWYTTEGGGVLARSSSGQVTGFGAGEVDDPEKMAAEFDEFMATAGKELFGGAIIIDDPVKPEDADSETIRTKINSRFDSTIRNRTNSRDTPIIVIGQRLHPSDLAGYLQREGEEDQWEVISLPCLYVNKEGELCSLWPFKHTVSELQKMKKSNDIVYERQYNQNPKPKAGLMFPIDELNFYDYNEMEDALNDADHCYIPVDPANLGGDDFAALVTKLVGKRIYIPNVLYNIEGADENERRVPQLVLDEKADQVGVEGVFGWAETARRIEAKLEGTNFHGEVRILRPRTNKHVRINSRSSFIKNNFWFRKDYANFPEYMKFMENLTSYLKIQAPGMLNKHDEAPDVCEMAGKYYEREFAHLEWNS